MDKAPGATIDVTVQTEFLCCSLVQAAFIQVMVMTNRVVECCVTRQTLVTQTLLTARLGTSVDDVSVRHLVTVTTLGWYRREPVCLPQQTDESGQVWVSD